ncbi:hypothetical protein KBC75_02455 [Candidatus Shapirobacteria bacterium]|nr:hypothetical protein [Candidatus Shapirobacteria bacterium]
MTSKYVINPLNKKDVESFLDDKAKEIIKYFIIKSLISQPEPLVGQKNLPIQVPKEHIEQWFTQALNVEPVGSGSYPIDIYSASGKWGADLKMLNMQVDPSGLPTKGDSGEASLGQQFKDTGLSLDTLFSKGKFKEIIKGWLTLYSNKLAKVKNDYEIDDIYYFFILRPNDSNNGATFYLTGARVDDTAIDGVSLLKKAKSSIFLKNFIPNKFGNTKIYKAKKRLELRLKPREWIESGNTIKITTDFHAEHINLRDNTIDTNFIKNLVTRIQNTIVKFET